MNMQKTPTSKRRRVTLASLLTVASILPLWNQSANAQSSLAQREIIRRQGSISNADKLLVEGREAYAKADYQQAVDKFRSALNLLPESPSLADRRQVTIEHLSDASVALSQQYRKVGKYTEAKALLENVLSPTVAPNNTAAKTELANLDDPIRTNPALDYAHTKNIESVRRNLYTAEGNYNLGKYDDAKKNCEDVLRVDPYNSAARRWMEKIASARSDYYRAAYDHTRAELLSQVDKAWELSVPPTVPGFITDKSDSQNGTGSAYITEKLRTIVIPSINFEDTPIEEAVDFLRLRASELDTREADPASKGVNFVVRTSIVSNNGGAPSAPVAVAGADLGLPGDVGAAPVALGGATTSGSPRIKELRLKNVTIQTALKYICEQTKLRYKVDDYAVTLVPLNEIGTDNVTRTFNVPPDFQARLEGSSGGTGSGASAAPADPFAKADASTSSASIEPRKSIIDLLKSSGIAFGDGASATLSGGNLLITNTAMELDKIDQLVSAIIGGQPKQVNIATKFINISQENTEELGFDWYLSPFGGPKWYGTGGTQGNGRTVDVNDLITNTVNSAPIVQPTFPLGSGPQSGYQIGNGLRSGDTAFTSNSINKLLSNPNRSNQSANSAPGILGISGVFGQTALGVMMRGLSQKKGADVMSAPSVTARSGQTAKIEVVREFIYPTEFEPPKVPERAAGATPVIPATPSSFTTRNTGVTLEISPTIGENDFVIDLSFAPEIVEFEGFVNYGSPINSPEGGVVLTENRIEMPIFSARRVKTALTIYDGYTVACGGLMREDVQNVEDKVPILGDIPYVGRLFQTKGETRLKSNLIIFVTAQIIDATGRPLRGSDASEMDMGLGAPVGLDGGVLPPLNNPQ